MFCIGFPVGFVWTLVFGPKLDELPSYLRNWVAYGTQSVGVYAISFTLEHMGIYSTNHLFAGMVFAGVGMLAMKYMEVQWKRRYSN